MAPLDIDDEESRAWRIPGVPRMFGWLATALLLMGVVWLIAPQQLPVSVYKLSLVTIAAVLGYWLDRRMFPYARPDRWINESITVYGLLIAACMLRRALIVAAAMLAMALGA